jgi:hypothetical protein
MNEKNDYSQHMNLQLDTITEQFNEFLKILNTPIFQFNGANISIGSIFISALIILTAYRAANYIRMKIEDCFVNTKLLSPFPQRDLHYPDGLPQKNIVVSQKISL